MKFPIKTFLIIGFLAQVTHGQVSQYQNMLIFAQDLNRTYLGKASSSTSDPESIMNTFGNYGSSFSQTSIRNNFSNFGSIFAQFSAYNIFSTSPPILYTLSNGVFTSHAFLTKNVTLSPRVDPDALIAYLASISPPATVTPPITIPAATAPVITSQPRSLTVATGESASFIVTAGGTAPLTYRWTKTGVTIVGATSATYTIGRVATSDGGTYTVTVSNSAGTVTSQSASLTVQNVVAPSNVVASPNSLSNLSVRTTMANGQTLIVGAVVNGGAKNILIRAAGPALDQFGLPGMADPRLELYTSGSTPVATNDNWQNSLAETFTAVGAFRFTSGSKDAALSQTLNGAFTVQAKGTGPGTLLVEAYDVAGGNSPRLINISARNQVGKGNDILIAGFAISGTGTKRVLIRAVGPTLAAFGVQGRLNDPLLRVLDSKGSEVVFNDNWDPALSVIFSQVGAFSLTAGSKDAAVLPSLIAGSTYTVQVSGADGGIGEALLEIYEVP